MDNQLDIIVIGAGLVGLATAFHLKQNHPDKKILVLEKEKEVAVHQSGHNSGVIHSGVYYAPGSQKALNCIDGYQRLLDFASAHHIPVDICGKVIVATKPTEMMALDNLLHRGVANGLKGLRILSPGELKEVEPHVQGVGALWVPQAGIIDYPMVARRLQEVFESKFGGIIAFNEKVVGISENSHRVTIDTVENSYQAAYVVNCSGLHSDRITDLMYPRNDVRIVPFKGEYYELKTERAYLIKNLVYPVADPNFPFLGVHFTRMIKGGVEAGPNAVLSLKREGYAPGSFSIQDTVRTLSWPGFWKIAFKYGSTGMSEVYRSLSKRAFTRALQKLVPEIMEDDLVPGGAGIRAQACSKDGQLLDDFDFKVVGRAMHVRNSPSPAATSCLSIGYTLAGEVGKHMD